MSMQGTSITDRRWPVIFGLIAFCHLYPFPYFDFLNNPNENVRVYQTMAIVEGWQLSIGRREMRRGRPEDVQGPVQLYGWVNDKALVCEDGESRPPRCEGRLYPAKASGSSLLAVPFYLAFRKVALWTGMDPPSWKDPELRKKLGKARYREKVKSYRMKVVYLLRLALGVIPSLLFIWFLRRYLRRETESAQVADLTVVAYSLGSLAFTYGLLFTGHHQAALALGGAFLALEEARRRDRAWLLVLGGFFLAAAPAMEYPAALPALVLGLYAMRVPGRLHRLGWIALGASLPVLGLMAYHHAAFGSPLSTPYDFLENASFQRDMAPGYQGVALPNLASFLGMFFSPAAGLFFYSGWLLLFAPGLVHMWRSGRRWTLVAVVGSTLAGLYFGASLPNWRKMLGWTLGPRYLTFMVPLMTVGAAWGIRWLEKRSDLVMGLVGALVLASILLTGVPSFLLPHSPMHFTNPVFQLHLPLLLQGLSPRTAGHLLGLSGFGAILPWMGAAALAWLLAVWRPPGAMLRHLAVRMLTGLLVAAALIYVLRLPHGEPSPGQTKSVKWFEENWEPAPGGERR